MAAMPRRAFLEGLVRLPLVGGGVTLLGQPTACAEPVTRDLLECYKTWLDAEQRALTWEMAGDPQFLPSYGYSGETHGKRWQEIRRLFAYVGQSGSYHGPRRASPYTRAALVLSTVGCDWRGGI